LDGLARHAVPNLVGCVRNVTETNSSPGAAVSLQDYAAMALRASTVHRSGAALVAANASSAFMRKVVSHMNTRLRVCQLAWTCRTKTEMFKGTSMQFSGASRWFLDSFMSWTGPKFPMSHEWFLEDVRPSGVATPVPHPNVCMHCRIYSPPCANAGRAGSDRVE
jgi:hypothetical protein